MEYSQILMERLHSSFPVFSTSWFYTVSALGVMANPVAIWVQAYKAWKAESVAGLSAITFVIICSLQLLTAGYAIGIQDLIIMVVMLLSALGSIAVLTAILWRRGSSKRT